ncbi:hypothetical protein O1V64_00235 (plasmid) [Rouxiella badensis]|uniref:Uncharacterized protein n=1 Tax=Rouxiella badensis TaxID=1646377 RepID=A0A1X0WAZ1_9GAMM|nr:hypothetical protein [Rouxiella badensis]ORJ23946.1 hypothetical protein BS640_18770 [Rouxiella badensis]WAT03194.1 hypothetical protein O1V64_00480 [Rouxiella badensis]WAT03285.1 hypothetical protein O1V64_00235 [Rouxiella badensis]
MQKHYELKYSFPSLADVQGIVKKIASRYEGLPASLSVACLIRDEAHKEISKLFNLSVEILCDQKPLTKDSVKVVQVVNKTSNVKAVRLSELDSEIKKTEDDIIQLLNEQAAIISKCFFTPNQFQPSPLRGIY